MKLKSIKLNKKSYEKFAGWIKVQKYKGRRAKRGEGDIKMIPFCTPVVKRLELVPSEKRIWLMDGEGQKKNERNGSRGSYRAISEDLLSRGSDLAAHRQHVDLSFYDTYTVEINIVHDPNVGVTVPILIMIIIIMII